MRALTAILVVCIAAVAASALVLLRSLHQRTTRRLAATSFLEKGRAMASALAESSGPAAGEDDAAMWQRLNWFFDTMANADPTLESLSIEKDGVTVFERQATLRGFAATDAPAPSAAASTVETEHVLQDVGGHSVPLVMFTLRLPADDQGGERIMQLGLRQDALAQDEQVAGAAVKAMFYVALTTHIVSLTILLGIIFWLMGREKQREERRRQEEHLAFAGVMANGVVHDFRNPMSAVRLDAQMLEREAAKPGASPVRMAELAGRIRTTLDRMESVFQEFFFLSQPSRRDPATLDLALCLRDCVKILEARFETAGLEVVFDLPAEPCLVHACDAPLRRAILNVLGNAVAFSPRGAEVQLELRRQRQQILLDVLDRGPGIEPDKRQQIFEMFVTSRPGGTGLGLFLARTALALSDGRIEALAREGGGTCIRISLPAAAKQV